jgi:hypothetical protein
MEMWGILPRLVVLLTAHYQPILRGSAVSDLDRLIVVLCGMAFGTMLIALASHATRRYDTKDDSDTLDS